MGRLETIMEMRGSIEYIRGVMEIADEEVYKVIELSVDNLSDFLDGLLAEELKNVCACSKT